MNVLRARSTLLEITQLETWSLVSPVACMKAYTVVVAHRKAPLFVVVREELWHRTSGSAFFRRDRETHSSR